MADLNTTYSDNTKNIKYGPIVTELDCKNYFLRLFKKEVVESK